jgi:hypothetical protein
MRAALRGQFSSGDSTTSSLALHSPFARLIIKEEEPEARGATSCVLASPSMIKWVRRMPFDIRYWIDEYGEMSSCPRSDDQLAWRS